MDSLFPLKRFTEPHRTDIKNQMLIENIKRLKIIGVFGSLINVVIISISVKSGGLAAILEMDALLRLAWIAASFAYIFLVGAPSMEKPVTLKHRGLFFGAATLSLFFSSLITGMLSVDRGYTYLYIINCMLTASFFYVSFAEMLLILTPSVVYLVLVMLLTENTALSLTSNVINIFTVTAFSILIATLSYQDRVAIIDAQEVINRHNKTLLDLAELDGLTRIPNRRKFDQVLGLEWAHALRNAVPLTILMIDVDDFKKYNDTYGHLAGDDCLRRIASLLTGSLKREVDFACRYGGEEFVLLLPDTTAEGGLHVGERIRQQVFEMGMPHEESAVGVVTISVGVATFNHRNFEDKEAFMNAADLAMYRSKDSGKNRVSC